MSAPSPRTTLTEEEREAVNHTCQSPVSIKISAAKATEAIYLKRSRATARQSAEQGIYRDRIGVPSDDSMDLQGRDLRDNSQRGLPEGAGKALRQDARRETL